MGANTLNDNRQLRRPGWIRGGMWLAGLLLWVMGSSCGGDPDDVGEPEFIHFVLERSAWAASNEGTTVDRPSEIVVTLAGPDGTRSERRSSEEGSLHLEALSPGTWQLRADGLDESGAVGWTSQRQTFQVEAGKQTQLTLTFEILP